MFLKVKFDQWLRDKRVYTNFSEILHSDRQGRRPPASGRVDQRQRSARPVPGNPEAGFSRATERRKVEEESRDVDLGEPRRPQ